MSADRIRVRKALFSSGRSSAISWTRCKSGSVNSAGIRSLMAENGVIFSDGVEADRLDFNAGAEVTIGIAARRGRLIV
ncbi:hypothetical protein [Bradyrhizobium sp. CCBAU 11386]|uniref:hypothetical protein n=1 Tax=Bradyrhizobium sp. CCBAU 11386 TaxID=1630837 RepID=UPI0023044CA0|nr:hypothetical protein [Bradyrhizobium sp. CCBAU 11386]